MAGVKPPFLVLFSLLTISVLAGYHQPGYDFGASLGCSRRLGNATQLELLFLHFEGLIRRDDCDKSVDTDCPGTLKLTIGVSFSYLWVNWLTVDSTQTAATSVQTVPAARMAVPALLMPQFAAATDIVFRMTDQFAVKTEQEEAVDPVRLVVSVITTGSVVATLPVPH